MEETPCPLCQVEDEEFLFMAHDRLHGIPGDFRVVRCLGCDLIYLNPRPGPEGMARFYPRDYFARKEGARSSRTRWKHRIRDVVLIRYYGYPGPEPSGLWRCLPGPWLHLLFKADRRNALVIPFQGKGRFLDVGCGSGRMLTFMRDRGWTVAGLEIDPEIARHLREDLDLEVFTGELTDCDFKAEAFDVVHLSHVLEHVRDPARTLEKARDLLAPGGRLYLRLPDGSGFAARRFRERWFGLDAPRHLCTYTRETVSRLLEKTGFTVEYVKQDRNASSLKNTFLFLRNDGALLLPMLARIKPLMRAIETVVVLLNRCDAMNVCALKGPTGRRP